MRYRLLIAFLPALAMAAGCGWCGPSLDVIVTDPSGAPVAGAAVTPVTPSMNGPARLTDESGRVTISRNQIQEVQWVSVAAEGFASRQVAVPRESVLRISMTERVQAGEYVFFAKLTQISMLQGSEHPAIATVDIDPRWIAEFMVTKIEKGEPPGVDGVVRYAIHSPSQKDLTDHVGRVYRIAGKLVPGRGSPHHEVTFEVQ